VTKRELLARLANEIAKMVPERVETQPNGLKTLTIEGVTVQVSPDKDCCCREQFSVIDCGGLSDAECHRLNDDVDEINIQELGGDRTIGDFMKAERVLLQRIGGQEALRSYVDCLMAMPGRVSLGRMSLGRPS